MKANPSWRWFAAASVAVAALVAGTSQAWAEEQPFKPYTEAIDADCPNCGWAVAEQKSNGQPSKSAVVPFNPGETCPICAGKGKLLSRIDWQNGFYLVEGFGVPPENLVKEYVATKSKSLLARMRRDARRAAEVDCMRNVVALAAKVRLDGDRLLGDMAQELTGKVSMMEEVGEGDWVEENVSYPFFKLTMKVPLWGAEGVMGVFYNKTSEGLKKAREKKKPFDWREALKEYKENPKSWEEKPSVPARPEDQPGRPEPTPGTEPGKQPEPVPGTEPGKQPEPVPGTEPGKQPEPVPGTEPGKQPEPVPGTEPGKQPEPGTEPPAGGTPTVPAKPEEVEPTKPTTDEEFKAKEASDVEEVIIDARGLQEEGGISPALFPKVEFIDKEGNKQTVYELSEVEEGPAKKNGMVQYVNSNTPFEKISKLAGPKTLVLRATACSDGSIRVAGLGLPIFLQEGVDTTGPKGVKKEKYQFKFQAVKASGVEKANIMVSAKDALELKKTDEAAKVLSKCKVIVIAGGDIAGKEGGIEEDRQARK